MTKFYATLLSFVATEPKRREEKGATAVEYGLLVALIAAVIIVAVIAFGETLTNIFNETSDSITDESGITPGGN